LWSSCHATNGSQIQGSFSTSVGRALSPECILRRGQSCPGHCDGEGRRCYGCVGTIWYPVRSRTLALFS
jgi:hypothetical protein